jgi:hypothetical protein
MRTQSITVAIQQAIDKSSPAGASAAELKELGAVRARVETIKKTFFGDTHPYNQGGTSLTDAASSGRFAALTGHDAIGLNRSYEPDRFMNLLNRTAVVVQKPELKYADVLNKGLNP